MEKKFEHEEIHWSAPEFHYYHKKIGWYWVVIGISTIIVGIALLQHNFLFALFGIVASFLVIAWGSKKPKEVNFTISKKGVTVGNDRLYPYDNFEGFAIIPAPEDPELVELIFKTKSRIEPWLIIILAEQRQNAVQEMLSNFLQEIEYEDSFLRHIGRMLRF